MRERKMEGEKKNSDTLLSQGKMKCVRKFWLELEIGNILLYAVP